MRIDPEWFSHERIDQETADFNQWLAATMREAPRIVDYPPEVVRASRELGEGPFGPVYRSESAVAREIPGPTGPIGLRVFTPENPVGVYLHLHGGGWTLGAAHHKDLAHEKMSAEIGVAVVSVDYRLAPENPYPAGPDDCEAAASWLANNAASEFGTARLTIGGESAGANLAAVTLVRMRDRHHYSGFSGANLVYGAYDVSGTPSQRNWGSENLILDTPTLDWFADHYVPVEMRTEPDVSPLYAELHDMPPALFTIGTLDPLLDDSVFMAARWMAAGNEAELAVYPGGVHAFDAFPIELARRARQRMHEFIVDALR